MIYIVNCLFCKYFFCFFLYYIIFFFFFFFFQAEDGIRDKLVTGVQTCALPIFALTFDPNRYKDEIERLAKEQTGRTLDIKGDIKMAFWPSLGADVAGVTLSERGSKEQFVAFDSAHASVKLMPLLQGQYIVDSVKLAGLKARIVKGKDGRYNFSDLLEGDAKKPAPQAKKEPEKGASPVVFDIGSRSEERRVGKECRSRWTREQEKKKR